MKTTKLSAVIIDDDRDDQFFIIEALRGSGGFEHIDTFLNGVEALSQLRVDSQLPDVIITDLKMPLMTGMEVLEELKKSDHLKAIPVIIFSTSSFAIEMDRARELGALGYITKPYHLHGFEDIARAIVQVLSDTAPGEASVDPTIKWFV